MTRIIEGFVETMLVIILLPLVIIAGLMIRDRC